LMLVSVCAWALMASNALAARIHFFMMSVPRCIN
jgi:hypothetical protein